jgi:trehalose 6-phosphate phosphatase
MRVLRSGTDVEGFFRGMARAPERVLFLDYDGTLAPFRARPEHAMPYAGVAGLVSAMAREPASRVVLVSGRPVAELRRAAAFVPHAEAWGLHGWQQSRADGARVDYDPGAAVRERLAEAARRAAALEPLGARVERKDVSVAVHWRGLDPLAAEAIEARLRARWRGVEDAALEILEFDGGVELRARGRHKGTVVREVLARCAPQAAAAYLGDDLTDEDAFAEIREEAGRRPRRLAVLVRPKLRRTRADLWLTPPGELLAFLRRWQNSAPRRIH